MIGWQAKATLTVGVARDPPDMKANGVMGRHAGMEPTQSPMATNSRESTRRTSATDTCGCLP